MKVSNVKKSVKTANRIGIVTSIAMSLVVANVLFTMVSGTHYRSGVNVLETLKSGSGYKEQIIQANRGNIYDRNQGLIAQDLESYNLELVIDKNRINESKEPAYVVDVQDTAQKLAPILASDVTTQQQVQSLIETRILEGSENKQFQVEFRPYSNDLSKKQKEDIEALNLPGISFSKSIKRVYPTDVFASQLIGFTKTEVKDNKEITVGAMGLESYFNDNLTGRDGKIVYQSDSSGYKLPNTEKTDVVPLNGDDIYTTLDRDAQLVLEKALEDTLNSNQAHYAWGIVMEAKTGKILAQAGYPTFSLTSKEAVGYNGENASNQATNYNNLPSEHVFEIGSVMKVFTYAAAMNEGVYRGSDTFRSGSAIIDWVGNNKVGRVDSLTPGKTPLHVVNDAEGKDRGTITFDQGLIYSTNTGIMSLLTHYLEVPKFIEYLNKFKLFEPVDIYGITDYSGTLNDNPFDQLMLGFGQGGSVNSYQIMQAATAIFGDGTMLKPYVIDKIVDLNTGKVKYQGKKEEVGKPITKETAVQMQQLLRQVVDDPNGTAHGYQMSDITMMAKTGTGQIYSEDGKGYQSDVYTSSILAAAPAENPEIIVYYAFESSNIKYYNRDYLKSIVRESITSLNRYQKKNEPTDANAVENGDFVEYRMPGLVNHSIDYVNQKLEQFNVRKQFIGDGTNIIAQFPSENETIISNQNIFLLSDGVTIKMPDMSGWSRKDVSVFAKYAGINVKYTGKGRVVQQSIPIETPLNRNDQLEIQLE